MDRLTPQETTVRDEPVQGIAHSRDRFAIQGPDATSRTCVCGRQGLFSSVRRFLAVLARRLHISSNGFTRGLILKTRTFKAGTYASFNVADVICPDLGQITHQIGPELEVSGEIDYLSDSGEPDRKFAVINVSGIHAPLIVPVERLRMRAAGDGEFLAKFSRPQKDELGLTG